MWFCLLLSKWFDKAKSHRKKDGIFEYIVCKFQCKPTVCVWGAEGAKRGPSADPQVRAALPPSVVICTTSGYLHHPLQWPIKKTSFTGYLPKQPASRSPPPDLLQDKTFEPYKNVLQSHSLNLQIRQNGATLIWKCCRLSKVSKGCWFAPGKDLHWQSAHLNRLNRTSVVSKGQQQK